jgi:hypothetical protein
MQGVCLATLSWLARRLVNVRDVERQEEQRKNRRTLTAGYDE